MATQEPIDGLVDTRTAALWLDIPFTTLRDMVTARRVPFTKVGKHVRFAQHHLDAIVAAGEQAVAKAPPRAQVIAIRAGTSNPPKTEPPRTPPPPTGPRTPPPPTGPKRQDDAA